MNAQPLTVDLADLRELRALRARQDEHASMIGRLVIEHADQKRALRRPGEPLSLLAFGALQQEYEQRLAAFLGKVQETRHAQQAAGEAALQRLGLDLEQGDYQIDHDNGRVLRLTAGAWRPLDSVTGGRNDA